MPHKQDKRDKADVGYGPETEEAAAECVSEDALVHLKSYKYSSVDKSPVSHYILRPYVCALPIEAFSRQIHTAGSSPSSTA